METEALTLLRARMPKGLKVKVGLILGSGLSHLADAIQGAVQVDYRDIPGFFKSTVVGHAGVCVVGSLDGVGVICMQGRQHLYEGATVLHLRHMVHTIKAIGASTLIVTNAAGSLNLSSPPGDVVMIRDQINFQGPSPLIGPNLETIGPRFPAMENAYDRDFRARVQTHLKTKGQQPIAEGVYLGVLGPQYETPAEIRAYKILGADLVGMSTVNEVILARHAGLKVLGFSAVTNYAAGMEEGEIRHDRVIENAARAAHRLAELVTIGVSLASA